VLLSDRFSGRQTAISDEKITKLTRNLALQQVPAIMNELNELTSSSDRKLPSPATCVDFIEGFPNVYAWRAKYRTIPRNSLVEAFTRAKLLYTETDDASIHRYIALLKAGLALVEYDYARNQVTEAFQTMRTIPSIPSDNTDIPLELLSIYYELLATEYHLKFHNIETATAYYKQAITVYPQNLSAQLKYAELLQALGHSTQVQVIPLTFSAYYHLLN
jgi:hypothetical protein